MRALKTVAIAFSMFSAVPMPQFAWDEDSMRYPLVALPLVGLLVGMCMWGTSSLCDLLRVSSPVRALLLTTIPLLITGGIHLDGFCDTWDALSSHREPERMRQILKDPHIGAFGVMHLALLLLTTFVLWMEIPSVQSVPLVLSFVLSRSLAGLSVATFPLASGDGLARSFASGSNHKVVCRTSASVSLLAVVGIATCGAWVMVLASLLVFLWYRLVIVRAFGGLSGDLCGWFIQTSELGMFIALYTAQLMEMVL